jgi:hypothetical protein
MIINSNIIEHDLREILMRDEPRVALIATARSLFSESLGHNKALYGFLSQHKIAEASGKDAIELLDGVLRTPKWHKLNDDLGNVNTFWVMSIAGNNPRLLNILKNTFLNMDTKFSGVKNFLKPEDFLDIFFEFSGPAFKNELMELPRYSRYFLEEASSCGQYFKVKDLNLDIKNPSREATKLVQLGYLLKNLEGEYSFVHRPLKAWLRYMRQVPLGRVLNVDIEVPRGHSL